MNLRHPRALTLAIVLVLGCTTAKVAAPPAPPPVRGTEPGGARDRPAPLAAQGPVQEGAGAVAATDEPAATAGKSAAAPPAREDRPLGWIAGQPLEAEELLLEWGDISSRELLLVVDKLVAGRLALAEAGRLGIRLQPEMVEQRFAAEKRRLEEQLARGKEDLALDDFIRRELGFEPERYLERVRRATIRQMLAERAVRASSLASESVALRLIVVADDEQRARVQEALAAGRDFGDVAREFSVDSSKQAGGLVPFVVTQERSPLARLAFQTPVGELAGPLPIGDHQFFIRTEERRAPLEGDWATIEAAVEAALVKHPVADAEFVHWKLEMEGRYPIDLGPLWSLLGAAK